MNKTAIFFMGAAFGCLFLTAIWALCPKEEYLDASRAPKKVLSVFNNLPYPIYWRYSRTPLAGQPNTCASLFPDGGCLVPGQADSFGEIK